MSTITTTAVAPTVGQQGTKTHGGHYNAYRACPPFAPTATLELISGSNPWRPATPGHSFYTQVLAQKPATIGKALELGAKAGFKVGEVQGHLRWLYTWGGSYIKIGGQVFSPVAPTPVAPMAPKVATPKAVSPKAKKSA
jgi:hypothetical protein